MISATYSGWEAAAAWLAPISRTCPSRRSAIHRCASGARFVGIPASALTQQTVPSLATPLTFAMTLGFVGYGLFLVRSLPVRADGVPPGQEPARAGGGGFRGCAAG